MKKENKKRKNCKEGTKCDWKEVPSINTDPLGSYTGVNTEDEYERPVQAADDL